MRSVNGAVFFDAIEKGVLDEEFKREIKNLQFVMSKCNIPLESSYSTDKPGQYPSDLRSKDSFIDSLASVAELRIEFNKKHFGEYVTWYQPKREGFEIDILSTSDNNMWHSIGTSVLRFSEHV